MNVLLIGSGGREHALAWKISRSPRLNRLFIAPGNPGTSVLGENVALTVSNHDAVIAFCRAQKIDLVVVGPEQPLVDGLADDLSEAGIAVFGPKRLAAQLEGSKAFAKSVMLKYGVPTAAYRVFSAKQIDEAVRYCKEEASLPIVLKMDGLAAGKGVFICASREEALLHLETIRGESETNAAAASLVIEAFMEGEEVSVFALCDGKSFVYLSSAQDHKRIGDGDTGPNTGGMGAYAPAPVLTSADEKRVSETVVEPMLKAMRDAGCPYVGILYCGLMMTSEGPKVVEFNCRFGDPECEVLMPLLKSDLLELMLHACHGTLEGLVPEFESGYACTVVLAAAGYPATPRKGDVITISDPENPNNLIFHSGTAEKQGKLITSGGRVINAVGVAATLSGAIQRAYETASTVSFEGKYLRTDIGKRGLERLR